MNKEKREMLVELHTELLDIAKEIYQKANSEPGTYKTDTRSDLIIAIYDKLFAMEMQKLNFQVQKGMMNKIPDVNKLLTNLMGGDKE